MSTTEIGMPLTDSLEVLREMRRDDDVVLTVMGTAREWMAMGQLHPLDWVYVPSSMGQAPSLGLGMALAQPDKQIIVCNGDGCMLMNLGALVTITAQAPSFTSILLQSPEPSDHARPDTLRPEPICSPRHCRSDRPEIRCGYGLAASSHSQTISPQPGQPEPYLSSTARSRSTPATLAIVANQASTSANSADVAARSPTRNADANSPTSSINHMNVPSIPRASSFDEYIASINRCN
jgi:hypothetical protein